MPQDLITIKSIVYELNALLQNSVIDKVSQPEYDELAIIIRANRANYTLIISANPNNPRLHLTAGKKFNPYSAPPFCMLLRKYLNRAQLLGVEIVNDDRIIRLNILSRNELSDLNKMSIIVELMGRYSNIILSDEDNKIIDALRHIPPDDKNSRIILPNIAYAPPAQNKISPFDYEKIEELLTRNQGINYTACLTENVGGLSYLTAAEIVARAKENSLGKDLAQTIVDELNTAANINETNSFKPCVLKHKGQYKDFFIFPYHDQTGEYIEYNTINEAADKYYSEKDKAIRIKSASKALLNTVRTHIKRAEKSLSYAEQKLLDCEKADYLRECGDMILANIHQIRKGMDKIEVDNYFTGGKSVIDLDITLNPQQNANRYYKKYSKLMRSRSIVTQQKEETANTLDYLNSVLVALNMAVSPEDAAAIKEELILEKIITEKGSGKVRKPVKSEPRYKEIEGFKVYCGRNNIENDLITFKLASSDDIFLHAKNIHGSHVIIITGGKKVPDKVIEKAANLAAYYSAARDSDKVPVDYTRRRNVKKHPSGKKGMVIYTDYSTAYVKPLPIE